MLEASKMASTDGGPRYNLDVYFNRRFFVDENTGHIFFPAYAEPWAYYYHPYSAGITEEPPARGYICPYRILKPAEFNVRDHPKCAFESFFFMEALL